MTAQGCLRPATCPVPSPSQVDLRRLRTAWMGPGSGYFTASWARHWPGLFNASGLGDARFSPLLGAGRPVPVLYAARSQTAVLLETVFHDIHATSDRLITPLDLAGRNLLEFELPERLVLYDLRDGALTDLGLERRQLVSTSAAHYACTREWADALRARRGVGAAHPVGLLWCSRVAELAKGDSLLLADLLPGRAEEVFVLFGDRLATTGPGHYTTVARFEDLSSMPALPLVASVAEQLGATLA